MSTYQRVIRYKREVKPLELIPSVSQTLTIVYNIVGSTIASVLMSGKTVGKTTWTPPPANDPTAFTEGS